MIEDWTSLLIAFGSGVFGAAIGGTPAFIFTGVAVLLGVGVAAAGGGDGVLTGVAFGAVFGPHISFVGAFGAASYAKWRGSLENGKDLGTMLMGIGDPGVLIAGGVFGVFGALVNGGLLAAGLGPWTDTIACTVVIAGLAGRLAFSKTGPFGKVRPGGRRWRPEGDAQWLPWQEKPLQLATIGLGAGLISGYMAQLVGESGGGVVLGFGVAAVSLVFLVAGGKGPVTHHIALPAALAVILSGSLILGGVVGVLAVFMGEFYSRLFLIHGDTYIDPPAAAIATMVALLRFGEAAGVLAVVGLP